MDINSSPTCVPNSTAPSLSGLNGSPGRRFSVVFDVRREIFTDISPSLICVPEMHFRIGDFQWCLISVEKPLRTSIRAPSAFQIRQPHRSRAQMGPRFGDFQWCLISVEKFLRTSVRVPSAFQKCIPRSTISNGV